MNKFKVGDKVRPTPTTPYLPAGATGTVNFVRGVCIGLEEFPDPSDPAPYHWSEFELAETELERLVRVVNEGELARKEMCEKYPNQADVAFRSDTSKRWCTVGMSSIVLEYRIKPKPTFEPFTVGQNWLVRLEDETLHIGCKSFPASPLRYDLHRLCRLGMVAFGDFYICRDGIQHDGYTISWADADRILDALDKAGVK